MVQRQQELTHEERISLGFLDHQTSQRGQLGSVGLERIGEEPGDVGQAKRRERQRRHGAAAIADATQRQRQGMHRVHFVVAVRADEEKAADPVVGENDASRASVAESAHCRSSRKRTSGCSRARRGRAGSCPKARLKRFCASAAPSSGTEGCGPTINSSSRQHVEDHPRVRLQRLDEIPPPDGEPRLAFRQELADQVTNRRHETPSTGRCAGAGRTSR